MSAVDATTVRAFLTRLGDRHDEAAELVLLGGSALLLLGNLRATVDIDYVGDDLQRSGLQLRARGRQPGARSADDVDDEARCGL